MRNNAWYPGLVSVTRAVLCWCSAFWLFTLTEYGEPRGIAVLPYLLFGVLSFHFFVWFFRKPRTIPAVAVAGVVPATVGSVVLLLRFSTMTGLLANVFGVFSVLTVVFLEIRACMEPPAAAQSIAALECTALFFLFFMWVRMVYGLELAYSLPLLTATLLSVSLVIYQRLSAVGDSGGHGRLRAVVIVALMLAAIAVVLALFMAFGAERLGQGMLMLWYGTLYCLKLLWSLLERFLFWLMSLVPAADGEMLAEPPAEMVIPEGVVEEASLPSWILILLGAVALCLAAAVVAYVLFRLRKVRIAGKGMPRTHAAERKRLPFGRWLHSLLAALRGRLYLLWAVVVMRGSPQELYLYLKRAGRRLDCRPMPGETPCAFVGRAARVTADSAEPELPRALENLAVSLGAALYAPKAPQPLEKETVRCIRRGFRRALRKARREQLRRWLSGKLSGKKTAAEEPS